MSLVARARIPPRHPEIQQGAFASWHTLGALILSPQEVRAARHTFGRLVVTGGGFDPIHPGHISCINACRPLGDTLAVVVNGDWFLKQKKGKSFMDLKTRSLIVSALKAVDIVVPYETDSEMGIFSAVATMQADVYGKGGDRDATTMRDYERYVALGVEVVTGLGTDKSWSSSWALDDWVTFVQNTRAL